MFNLIKNEYIKIFHKNSTYILIALLLAGCVALPAFKRFYYDNDTSEFYYSSYDEEIGFANEVGDPMSAAMYEKAKELKIPESEFFIYENRSWRSDALNDAYDTYYLNLYGDSSTLLSGEAYDEAKERFDTILSFVAENDWEGYCRYQIDIIRSNPDIDNEQKETFLYTYQYMLDHNVTPGTGSWQEEALDTYTEQLSVYNEGIKAQKENTYYDRKNFKAAKERMLISKYRLDNDLKAAIYKADNDDAVYNDETYIYTGNLYDTMKDGTMLLLFIIVIVVVAAGNIIAQEFSQGTVKFLLINPVTRNKIFWSKYITVFTYALFLTIAVFFTEFAASLCFFGPSEIGAQLLSVHGNEVVADSGFLFMAGRYLLAFVEIVIAATAAIMLSSLFRNSALSIALSMICAFTGSKIATLAALLNIDFFRYSIFAAQDITSVVDGVSPFLHMTTGFASCVIAIHLFLMLFIAHDAFTRRNV